MYPYLPTNFTVDLSAKTNTSVCANGELVLENLTNLLFTSMCGKIISYISIRGSKLLTLPHNSA